MSGFMPDRDKVRVTYLLGVASALAEAIEAGADASVVAERLTATLKELVELLLPQPYTADPRD